MEPFAMSIAHGSYLLKNKIQMGMQKMKVQLHSPPPNSMLHPTALYDEIGSCTLLPGKFLQTFSNASQAFLIVAFSFVLRSWNLNSHVIWRPTKIFILASLILGNFCLQKANPSLSLSTACQSP